MDGGEGAVAAGVGVIDLVQRRPASSQADPDFGVPRHMEDFYALFLRMDGEQHQGVGPAGVAAPLIHPDQQQGGRPVEGNRRCFRPVPHRVMTGGFWRLGRTGVGVPHCDSAQEKENAGCGEHEAKPFGHGNSPFGARMPPLSPRRGHAVIVSHPRFFSMSPWLDLSGGGPRFEADASFFVWRTFQGAFSEDEFKGYSGSEWNG